MIECLVTMPSLYSRSLLTFCHPPLFLLLPFLFHFLSHDPSPLTIYFLHRRWNNETYVCLPDSSLVIFDMILSSIHFFLYIIWNHMVSIYYFVCNCSYWNDILAIRHRAAVNLDMQNVFVGSNLFGLAFQEL